MALIFDTGALWGLVFGTVFYCGIVASIVFADKLKKKPKKAAPKKRVISEPNKIHQPGPSVRRKARAPSDSELWDREQGR